MNKGVKFRIYPNKEQQCLINRTFGCCRFVYNHALDYRQSSYKNGIKVYYKDTSAKLTAMKEDPTYSFLKEVDSIALQQSLRDLDLAYQRFFKHLVGYPRFKNKHGYSQSYRTINQNGSIRIVGRYIKLPKLGYVKVRQSMDIGHINHATVECTSSGKYFVVLNIDYDPVRHSYSDKSIGLDMGITHFYTDSNGCAVSNPRYLDRSLRKLKREQRRLSRKCKGSGNYDKQRIRVALAHEKVTCQRTDFLQKLSTMLIRENQTICIEDLAVRNMVHNHKLARHISDASWSTFVYMLEYKAMWYGNEVVKVPRMYASSQICHCCGYKNPLVKDMSVRKWTCPQCGMTHDRDENAAINILNKGLSAALKAS